MTPPRWRSLARLAPAIAFCLLALLGRPLLAVCGRAPDRPDMQHTLSAPDLAHWFGTDVIGRDVLSRVIAACGLDLGMACSAVLLSAVGGSLIGGCCALASGWTDRLLQRVVDVAMAFPLFIVALAVVAVFGNTLTSVILATALINLPFYARLSRAEIAVRRDASYVHAARLAGWREARILTHLLLPSVAPALLAQMTVNIGWAMLNGASLSFLGLGVQAPAAEWGVMTGEGARYILSGQWWLAAAPGGALCLAVLSFSLAAEQLTRWFDPKRAAS